MVADITIQLNSDYPVSDNTFHPKFKQFEVPSPGIDKASIHHHFKPPCLTNDSKKNYTEIYKKSPFHIFKSENTWIFYYTSLSSDDLVKNAIAIMNNDFTSTHIYTVDLTRKKYSMGSFPALTLLNTDQMLFAKLLCDRHGVMIHSNGSVINGKGVLLAGISGSGKSTLSGMLKKHNHDILCDDRMFVRKQGGSFWIYGNWCYGSHPDASPGSAPLDAFVFLEKGSQNDIHEIKNKKYILPRLLQVLVKPLLDADGWQNYFSTIENLMDTIPFYQIEFDLSGKIGDKINSFFGACA